MDLIEEQYVTSILEYPDMLVETLSDVPIQAIKDKQLQVIYTGIIELWEGGHTVDSISVHARINNHISLGDLVKKTNGVPSKVNLPHYAGELKRTFQKRRIYDQLEVAQNNLKIVQADEVLKDISQLVAEEMHIEKKNPHIKSAVKDFKKTQAHNKQHGMGLRTGFECFDKAYITYQQPHCWIVGGFTSTGKTAFCIEMLHRLYENNNNPNAIVVSTEMNTTQNIGRLIARKTTYGSHYIISGTAREAHQEEIDKSLNAIEAYNLQIHDDIYDLQEIKALVRKQKHIGGVDMVFIDYAQNISVKGAVSEYAASDAIAKGIQKLAKECECCIVMFSQISNSAAKDDMGILQYKGSGSYSSITDMGVMLKKNKQVDGMIQLKLAKHRHGPLLTQSLQFKDHFNRLEEVDYNEE